jgi:hypothetical protein
VNAPPLERTSGEVNALVNGEGSLRTGRQTVSVAAAMKRDTVALFVRAQNQQVRWFWW